MLLGAAFVRGITDLDRGDSRRRIGHYGRPYGDWTIRQCGRCNAMFNSVTDVQGWVAALRTLPTPE